MKALILAAGSGIRLAPITEKAPKALLPIGSQTVIERLLYQLKQFAVEEVVVVAGYEADQIVEHVRQLQSIPPVTFVFNKNYDQTGTAVSAQMAFKQLKGCAFVLIDGDTVLSERAVKQVHNAGSPSLFYEAKAIFSPEEIKIGLASEGHGVILGKESLTDNVMGEFLGVAKFDANASEAFFAALDLVTQNRPKAYYEDAIVRMSSAFPFALEEVAAGDWIEIDFITDYLQAVRLFSLSSSLPNMAEQILLCPGPVLVSSKVKQALLHSDIGHRETEFIEVLTRVRQKLNKAFGVSSGDYTNVVITGSGTAANESLISSYGPGKRIIFLTNGEFGNRLIDLANCHGIDAVPVDFGWGHPIDVNRVASILQTERVDALYMVHHETSTGMLNPIDEIGNLLERRGIDFLVDAVSSLGAERLSVEESKITFCTSSANKAIAALPGLSFVCGKKSAFMALKEQPARTRYLDLYRTYQYEELSHQTPNTPAVSLFFALEAALDELLADTVEKRVERCAKLSHLIRSRLKEMGVQFVIPEDHMSSVLTTVFYPEGLDVEAFHSYVKDHNYVIYRGKGPYLGKAFQIANIGHVTEAHVLAFLSLLEGLFQSNESAVTGRR